MLVNHTLASQGIRFENVAPDDLITWLESKKECYRSYVDQYYGGRIDDVQNRLNTKSFTDACAMSFFRKITLEGETVGFFGYNETQDRIDRVTIHMYEHARNHGIGSYFLHELTELSKSSGKTIYLKVFKSNPAQALYQRYGFHTYDETSSHFLMRFSPKQTA